MNDKEFFKQALKDEMPDLEKVRQQILKTNSTEKPKIKSFDSQILLKKVLPAVACVAIIAVSTFAALKTDNSDKIDVVQGTRNDTSVSQKVKEKAKKKGKEDNSVSNNENKNNDSNFNNNKKNSGSNKKNKNKNKKADSKAKNSENNEVQTTSYQKVERKDAYLSSPKKSSYYFGSTSELKNIASKLKVADDGTVYHDDENNTFRLTFARNEISMLLNGLVYSNSEVSSGVIKRVGGVVCCEFSLKGYKVGYTLSQTSISDNNYKTKSNGGYCFFINSDSDEAEELLENLSFSPEYF